MKIENTRLHLTFIEWKMLTSSKLTLVQRQCKIHYSFCKNIEKWQKLAPLHFHITLCVFYTHLWTRITFKGIKIFSSAISSFILFLWNVFVTLRDKMIYLWIEEVIIKHFCTPHKYCLKKQKILAWSRSFRQKFYCSYVLKIKIRMNLFSVNCRPRSPERDGSDLGLAAHLRELLDAPGRPRSRR